MVIIPLILHIGATITSLYRGDMWFHHIQRWKIFIKDKFSISICQNDMNIVLEPHFFLLYEIAQNDMVLWTISHFISQYECIFSIRLLFGLATLLQSVYLPSFLRHIIYSLLLQWCYAVAAIHKALHFISRGVVLNGRVVSAPAF